MEIVRDSEQTGEKRALEGDDSSHSPKRVAEEELESLVPRSRRADEELDSDEEREYEESARRIAEKVQRQQEGKESALLEPQHKDESYLTVDEIQRMLEDQRKSLNGGILSTLSSSMSSSAKTASETIGDWYVERAKYIPLRLEYKERTNLRRVMAVMRSCEYTNLVDGVEHKSKAKRVMRQAQCIHAILMGIATSFRFDLAQKLLDEQLYSKYKNTYTKIFEIARRYKVMNPEKMRGLYGKMIFMLQDAMSADIRENLEFDMVAPMQTVHNLLEKHDAEEILRSEWISTATMEILPDGKSRSQIQAEIKQKERAIDLIARKHAKKFQMKEDDIKRCLYSIADNTSYLNSNCKPIDFVIDLLKDCFGQPETKDTRWSLAIYGGEDGSRLTHSHARQYHYVLQSLTLWREIVHDMFRLWYLSEQDLLDPSTPYKLVNTGQGFNRLQSSPRTSRAMHGILYAVQQKLGHTVEGWVGSSVIHLGDTNVPNALMFIDKYNQVPRILNPIVQCIKYIRNILIKDAALVRLVEGKFGSLEDAIKTILHDFFRRAFDGSGADNFFEAGSCIDGRLTSAWNWCQELPDKDYYFLFKLSGFLSFDGDFR